MDPQVLAQLGQSGGTSPARLAALSLKEFDRHIRWHAAMHGPLQVPLTDEAAPAATAREADGGDAEPGDVSVRESASVSDLPGLMAAATYRTFDNWFRQYRGAFMDYAYQLPVADYKVNTRVFPAEMEDALEIREERDYIDSGLMDKPYTYSLRKWGRAFTVPYKVFENDDKGFFAEMPQRMTRSAERTIAKIVVRQTLEANPNAYDALPIFSASRGNALFGGLTGNLVSGAGSALSSANIQAGLAAVNTFVGDIDLNPSGVPLNIPASYLVVPPSLALQAAQMLNSTVLIAAGTANPITVLGNENPIRQTDLQPIVRLIVERYLTNTTAYYLLPEGAYGPLGMVVRQGRGLRPRLMRNIPMRQSIGGGGADEYQMLVDDLTFVWNFDLNGIAFKPWSSIKFAGA